MQTQDRIEKLLHCPSINHLEPVFVAQMISTFLFLEVHNEINLVANVKVAQDLVV